MDFPPGKKKRERSPSPSQPRANDFQKNDLELLQSGMLADGTIKCQGRTWKVHRALLSSRLKFFKAAFCGAFAEAASREVELPEATPDSVDIMIRHLYGEELNLEALNTPLLCVCSWKLADYLQLDTIKPVAASALQEHLNAMLLLASSDKDLRKVKPVWLMHFMDAFREVCTHMVLRPLQSEFVAFLWIARFEILCLGEIWEILDNHHDVRDQLHQLLIFHKFSDRSDKPLLVPWDCCDIESEIQTKRDPRWEDKDECSLCGNKKPAARDSDIEESVRASDEPWFYNPLPMIEFATDWDIPGIGEETWCKGCAYHFIEGRSRWPWVSEDRPRIKRFRPKAWSWTDGDHKSL